MIHSVHLSSVIKRIGGWLKEPLRLVLFFIFAGILSTGTYLGWHHFVQKENTTQSSLTGAEKQEKMDAQETAGYLTNKDYTHYQTNTQNLAREYLDYGSITDAERLMNELFAKVPAADINPDSYSVMVEVQQAKKDNNAVKKYLTFYIDKLRTVGNKSDAALAQKTLDKLQ